MMGGDNFRAKFLHMGSNNVEYRGNVADNDDGIYTVNYSIPISGKYKILLTLNDEPVNLCIGASGDGWHEREYDGHQPYLSPAFCALDYKSVLNVIHHDLHALSSTIVETESHGLTHATIGISNGFTVEARDKFGNIRAGLRIRNIPSHGDGASDAFLVHVRGPVGYMVSTSSAVQIISCADSTVIGFF